MRSILWKAGIRSLNKAVLLLFVFLLTFHSGFAQKTEIITKKFAKSTDTYGIKAEYPQMKVPKDALMGVRGMMGDFNGPIENIVDRHIAEFKAIIYPMDSVATKADNSLNIIYETFSDNKNIFSIKFESFSEIYHSAHPNSTFDSYNFNYDSWTPFALKDIFMPSSDYLKKISDYCIADLKKQAKEKNMEPSGEITKGASADEKNFSIFNISGDRILFTFQYYQVGPRPAGAPVVSMPLSNLKDMIDPKGPLGYILTK